MLSDINDGNKTWSELVDARAEHYGERTHRDTVSKGFFLMRPYMEQGWIRKPSESQPNVSGRVLSTSSDGSQVSEGKFSIENEEMLRDSEFLLKLHNYDPSKFELVNSKNSFWDTQVKGGELRKLYSSKVTVKPRSEVSFEFVKDLLVENSRNFKKHESYEIEEKHSDQILEINISDLHLGKLCWHGDTGNNFDHRIAVDRFKYIISDILDQAKHLDYEKVYFIWSNDFYHYDTTEITTTAGTRQDSSIRWQKMFRVGVELLVWAIDEIVRKTKSHVETFYIGSNHDKMTSYFATNYLYAWYKDDPNVSVSYDCIARKFVEYGNVMLGFCHGSEEGKNISNIMAKEKPEIYGRTKFRYMQAAHLHSNQSRPISEECGCEVRYLSSPTSDDAWHYGRGFIGAIKCGYGFVYDKELGRRLEIRSNIIK